MLNKLRPSLLWIVCLSDGKCVYHQHRFCCHSHIHNCFVDWKVLPEWNLFRLAKHIFQCSEFMQIRSAKEPGLPVLLSLVPSLIRWVFKRLNCFNPFLFTILLTNERLTPVCFSISVGDIWLPGLSSYEHIKYKTISSFSAVVAVWGLPESGLLSIDPFSLNRFKSS